MEQQPWLALALAQYQHERMIEAAARERLVGHSSPSVRRAVGRRIMAIGARIAAEPSMELARSRR
jgi:hypothetical protein